MSFGGRALDMIKRQKANRKLQVNTRKKTRKELRELTAAKKFDKTYNEEFARDLSAAERASVDKKINGYRNTRMSLYAVVFTMIGVATFWLIMKFLSWI